MTDIYLFSCAISSIGHVRGLRGLMHTPSTFSKRNKYRTRRRWSLILSRSRMVSEFSLVIVFVLCEFALDFSICDTCSGWLSWLSVYKQREISCNVDVFNYKFSIRRYWNYINRFSEKFCHLWFYMLSYFVFQWCNFVFIEKLMNFVYILSKHSIRLSK